MTLQRTDVVADLCGYAEAALLSLDLELSVLEPAISNGYFYVFMLC